MSVVDQGRQRRGHPESGGHVDGEEVGVAHVQEGQGDQNRRCRRGGSAPEGSPHVPAAGDGRGTHQRREPATRQVQIGGIEEEAQQENLRAVHCAHQQRRQVVETEDTGQQVEMEAGVVEKVRIPVTTGNVQGPVHEYRFIGSRRRVRQAEVEAPQPQGEARHDGRTQYPIRATAAQTHGQAAARIVTWNSRLRMATCDGTRASGSTPDTTRENCWISSSMKSSPRSSAPSPTITDR